MDFILYCASRDYYKLKSEHYKVLEKNNIPYTKKIVKMDDEEETVTIISIDSLQDLLHLQNVMENSIVIDTITLSKIPELMIYDDYIE